MITHLYMLKSMIDCYCRRVLLLFSTVFVFGGGMTTAWAQPSFRGLPLVTNFTTEEYGGGIQNWDITQDMYGLLYVANNFGLLVYDGEQWVSVPIEEATRTRAVAYGPDQHIYVAGQGDFGYFSPTPHGALAYTSLKQQLPEEYQNFDEVWKIYTQGEGVYFCTFQYIFQWEDGNITIIDPGNPLGFTFKVRNQLFTQIPSKGLMKVEGGQMNTIRYGSQLQGKDVRGMAPFDMKRTLLATRDEGLFFFGQDGLVPWDIPVNASLKTAQINALAILSNNMYAVGTQNQGLYILNKEGRVIYALTKGRGLVSNTVLSLFEDVFDNLWLGLNNGISFIELGEPFTLIDDNLGLLGTGYTAFKYNDQLFLGTSNGVFTLDPGSESLTDLPRYQLLPGTEGQTYSLQNIQGKLLLGHHKGGFELSDSRAVPIQGLDQGIWKFEPIPGNPNRLLAGSYTGMQLMVSQGSTWQVQKKHEKLNESSRKFEPGQGNSFWMTHGYKGVFKLDFSQDYEQLSQVQFYGEESGFPSNLLINVFPIENRLVFAAEHNVYEYSPEQDSFVMDAEFSAYFDGHHVRELEEDLLGNIYFISDAELGVLKKNSLGQYDKEATAFRKIKRFVSDDLENITVIDGENVLINAQDGFIHYDPTHVQRAPHPFSTVIRQISWGDSTLFGGYFSHVPDGDLNFPKAKPPKLPFSKKAVRFRYASPYFEGDEHNEYQYWLENFDADWSHWSPADEKEYTNLPAGKYTFHVRSRNSAGDISEPMAYCFQVLPPWYLSAYAYAVYFSLGMSFLAIGFIFLDRRYKMKQRSLIKTTSEAIRERESKLQEVTEQSEKEISKLRREQLESELKYKNQELASSAMHLITKNEFMNYLKLEISHLLKEQEPKTVSKGLRRIVKTIEKNIAEDEIWDQFEIHFDQVHGDFIKKLREQYPNLTPQEVKLSAFLRMNMSSKEIAHLLTISVRGVEVSRYRLRKKLPIESHENLVDFMMKVG